MEDDHQPKDRAPANWWAAFFAISTQPEIKRLEKQTNALLALGLVALGLNFLTDELLFNCILTGSSFVFFVLAFTRSGKSDKLKSQVRSAVKAIKAGKN